jgi:hypothetical protein
MKLQLIVFISSCKDSSRDFITFSRTTSGLYLNLMADIMEHLSLLRFSIDKLRRLVGLFISTLEELQWAMLLLIFINQRFQRLTRSDQIIPNLGIKMGSHSAQPEIFGYGRTLGVLITNYGSQRSIGIRSF